MNKVKVRQVKILTVLRLHRILADRQAKLELPHNNTSKKVVDGWKEDIQIIKAELVHRKSPLTQTDTARVDFLKAGKNIQSTATDRNLHGDALARADVHFFCDKQKAIDNAKSRNGVVIQVLRGRQWLTASVPEAIDESLKRMKESTEYLGHHDTPRIIKDFRGSGTSSNRSGSPRISPKMPKLGR